MKGFHFYTKKIIRFFLIVSCLSFTGCQSSKNILITSLQHSDADLVALPSKRVISLYDFEKKAIKQIQKNDTLEFSISELSFSKDTIYCHSKKGIEKIISNFDLDSEYSHLIYDNHSNCKIPAKIFSCEWAAFGKWQQTSQAFSIQLYPFGKFIGLWQDEEFFGKYTIENGLISFPLVSFSSDELSKQSSIKNGSQFYYQVEGNMLTLKPADNSIASLTFQRQPLNEF